MSATPAVRAAHSKHCIALIKRLDEALAREILAGIEDARTQIRHAGSLEWLPAEHHVKVADAIASVLSPIAAKAYWRDLLLDSFDRPLIKPFAAGALRVYENDPRSLIRMTSLAWKAALKHCGEPHVVAEENGAYVRWTNLPPLLYESVGMHRVCEGALQCTYTHFGWVGLVRRVASARPDEFCFEVEWKRP